MGVQRASVDLTFLTQTCISPFTKNLSIYVFCVLRTPEGGWRLRIHYISLLTWGTIAVGGVKPATKWAEDLFNKDDTLVVLEY